MASLQRLAVLYALSSALRLALGRFKPASLRLSNPGHSSFGLGCR